MNNKDNVHSGELSAQQRARISQNFRAAKALFDRKRPHHTADFSDHFLQKNRDAKRIGAPARPASCQRVPLSNIPTNLPSPDSVDDVKLINGECNGNSCSKSISTTKTDDSLGARTIGLPIGNGTVLNSFETPLQQQQCSNNTCSWGISINRVETNSSRLSGTEKGVSMKDEFARTSITTPIKQLGCSSLSKSFTSSGVLDEDFDESILEEIDALCKQKPVANPGGDGYTRNFKMESNSFDKGGGKTSSYTGSTVLEEFNAEGIACSIDDPEYGAKRLKTSDSTEHGRLMEEFGKYMHSPGNKEKKAVFSEEMSKFEGMLDSNDGQKYEAEESRSSEATQGQNMPEEYAKYIKSLNDRQQEAACSDISVPLMIIAGPGSGKTSTMVGRVLILLNKGISPSHILAMTFTTAAASEMRERIGAVAGKTAAKELTISTFHSFSLQLCRSHAEKLGRTPEFLIYGHGQQRRAVIEAVRLLENGKNRQNHDTSVSGQLNDINSPQGFKEKSKKWMKFVTQAKAAGRTTDDCLKMGDEIGATILRNYGNILKSCNALDYHDLISCSVKLLSDFPEVFKDCQESWKAIVIDEFQDTSAMQYCLLQMLASHKCITIVGDEDQSIFSFNGADVSGFDSFRKDFPMHKEIRLNKNYRSTRCIVEAASSLIQNNLKRCQSKSVLTDNSSGSKITIKECCNEESQCAFIVDKILEFTSDSSFSKCSFGDIAVLYRRQVSGKNFQSAFRNRKIPFNVHGVAFYRKKVVRAIIALLKTTLPGCDDSPFRRVFKALLSFEKEEKKKVIEHIDKISTVRKCSFISAARDIFSTKISGTFKRSQLTQGRKVLLTLDMVLKLVHREQSISAVITSVANMIPQKYLLEQRAVIDIDGGKFLNEDNDLRSVLQYLLDDVSEFLTTQPSVTEGKTDIKAGEKGCADVLKDFVDYISERERENFRSRRHDNENSVTLTTIHQSKGLEWDTVFIVKANESEIPLLHEFNGVVKENGASIEEERRLLYVAMTRARKKLFILYVIMDSTWQLLQPSRFLREIPSHLQEIPEEPSLRSLKPNHQQLSDETYVNIAGLPSEKESPKVDKLNNDSVNTPFDEALKEPIEAIEAHNGNYFLTRFKMEDRAVVSHLFHQWAKKPAFQDPKRLLNKVAFVIDERLRVRKSTHKDLLRELKSCLKSDESFHYAEYVLKWEQIPADKRAYIMREKQEHFQKLRMENAMSSSTATAKQIAYLQNLGCTVVPTSRLHASRLIEQYKSL